MNKKKKHTQAFNKRSIKQLTACNDNYITGFDEYELINDNSIHIELMLENRIWNERNYFED